MLAIPNVDQGYLSCHPMGMINSLDMNIGGRTSFITAYGSTSREAGIVGEEFKNTMLIPMPRPGTEISGTYAEQMPMGQRTVFSMTAMGKIR